ncbi:hypothetical protein CDIK_1666 [Cucumispora dikerogammari]|nr:hypothetical protein CDIK_1666 [Cucumispora dikerogammari]
MSNNQKLLLLECKKCETILCDLQEDLLSSSYELYEEAIKEDRSSILCINCGQFIGERYEKLIKIFEKNVARIILKKNVVDFLSNIDSEREDIEENEIKDIYEEIDKLKKFCVYLYKNQNKKR